MTCTCGTIQAADPTRHFKECPERVERAPSQDPLLLEYQSKFFDSQSEVRVLREELRKSLNREKLLNENLDSVQKHCSQLLNELRVSSDALKAVSRCIILKGWTCSNPVCRVFNGEEKEILLRCRCCEMEKPKS